jgi:hypothetical protein
MKNTIKLFVIIAVVAVIGFSFVACGPGEENLYKFENRSTYDVTVTITGEITNGVTSPFTLKGFISGTGDYDSKEVIGTGLKYTWSPKDKVIEDDYYKDKHVFIDKDDPLSVKQ